MSFAESSSKWMKTIHLNLRQALPSPRDSTAAIRRILILSLLILLTGALFTSWISRHRTLKTTLRGTDDTGASHGTCAGRAGNWFRLISSDLLLATRQTTGTTQEWERLVLLSCSMPRRLVERFHMLDKTSMLRSAQGSSLLTRVWRCVRPCFSWPTASCVRYSLKNILSHLESSVIMTPDHRTKGRAAWNVLDFRFGWYYYNVVHVREHANLLQNLASVNGLSQSAKPWSHSVPSSIYLPCFTTKKMVHGLYEKSGGVPHRSFTWVWLKMCADYYDCEECGGCVCLDSEPIFSSEYPGP